MLLPDMNRLAGTLNSMKHRTRRKLDYTAYLNDISADLNCRRYHAAILYFQGNGAGGAPRGNPVSSRAMSLFSVLSEQVQFKLAYLRTLLTFPSKELALHEEGIYRQLPNERPRVISKVSVVTFSVRLLSIALCLADSVCGVALCHYLGGHRTVILCNGALVDATLGAITATRNGTQWIMDAPAGLKVNRPLTEFLGGHICGALDAWELIFRRYLFSEPEFFRAIWWLVSVTSVLGVSVVLALLLDLLKVTVGYILTLYNIFAGLHSVQVSVLLALLRLFLGKKWNPLRNRMDQYDYDTMQLLVGTLLLSIVVFLLPTLGMYYVMFLSLKLALAVIRYAGKICIVCINRVSTLPFSLYRACFWCRLSQTRLSLANLSGTEGSNGDTPSHLGRLVQVEVSHPMLPHSVSIEEFMDVLQKTESSTIVDDYFTKHPPLVYLPSYLRSLPALHFFAPSFTARLKYIAICIVTGEIFDF